MEESKNHKKTGFHGFIKYLEDNLTGREKNEFERELQKDPFAAEADEGFSELKADELGRDMEILSNRLRRRTSKSSRRTWYRIAAVVSVLLGLSAVVLMITRSPGKTLSEKSGRVAENTEKIREEKAVRHEEAKKEIVVPAPVETVKIPSGGAAPVSKSVKEKTRETEQKTEKAILPDTIKDEFLEAKQDLVANEKSEEFAPPAVTRSVFIKTGTREIKGRITSSDDNSPLPGATVTVKGTIIGTVTDRNGEYRLNIPDKGGESLQASSIGWVSQELPLKGDSVMNMSLVPSVEALQEVVVTGYSARKAADRNLNADEEISYPPEPKTGKSAFDSYIRNNIRRPSELNPGDRAVVVLNFIVRVNGTVDSITVARSPGRPFTDEAIRLLKEGPSWKPATENGKPVESNARLRIVFK